MSAVPEACGGVTLTRLGEIRSSDEIVTDCYRPGHKNFYHIGGVRRWSWMERSPWLLCARGGRDSAMTCVDAHPVGAVVEGRGAEEGGQRGRVRLVPVAGFLRAAVRMPYVAWALSEDWFMAGTADGRVAAWSLKRAHAAKYMGPWWIDDELEFDRLSDFEPRAKAAEGAAEPIVTVALAPEGDLAVSLDGSGHLRGWRCEEHHPPRKSPLSSLAPLWTVDLPLPIDADERRELTLLGAGRAGVLLSPAGAMLFRTADEAVPVVDELPRAATAAAAVDGDHFLLAGQGWLTLCSAIDRGRPLDEVELAGEPRALTWMPNPGLVLALERGGEVRAWTLAAGAEGLSELSVAGDAFGSRVDGESTWLELVPSPAAPALAVCTSSGHTELFRVDGLSVMATRR